MENLFNIALLRKEFRELRWLLWVGIIVLSLMGIIAALTWLWTDDLFGMLDLMGQEFRDLMEGEMRFAMDSLTNYLWSQWHPKNLLQIGTLLAIIIGAQAVASEVNRGSIEFLISRPVSRASILIHKSAAGAIILSLAVWVSTLFVIGTGMALGSVHWQSLLAATFLTNIGLFIVQAFATWISVHSADAIKAGAISAALLALYSVLGMFRATSQASFFWQMRGISWFVGGGAYPWLAIVGMITVTLLLFGLAIHQFAKKEY